MTVLHGSPAPVNCTHLYSNLRDPPAPHRPTLKSPPLARAGRAPAGAEAGAGVEAGEQRELSAEALAWKRREHTR